MAIISRWPAHIRQAEDPAPKRIAETYRKGVEAHPENGKLVPLKP